MSWVSQAHAAFTSDGTLITANQKTTVTSWSPTTAAALEVGHLGVVTIAFDNLQTTDGASSTVTSVTDAAGNTWTKAYEQTNGEGSAGAGVTTSVWYTVATTQLNSAATITFNFSGSVTARAVKGQEFSGLVGSTIDVEIASGTNYDAADVGSVTPSGASNVEHIFYRGIGAEFDSNVWTATVGWSKSNATNTTGSTSDTNVAAGAEFKIATGTSTTASDPTWYTADFATVLLAFNEPAPTPTPTSTPHNGAFSGLGTFLTAATKTTGTSYSPSTTGDLEVGHLAVIAIAADNVSTTDGNTTLVSSVTDVAGNTWTKAREYTNGQGSAAAGATISVWYSSITSHLAAGQTLTITFASSIDAKAVKGYEFLKPSGTISVDPTLDAATDGADVGAMQASGSTVGDFIFIRAVASEETSNTWTETDNWTKVNTSRTTGGDADTNIGASFEFKIESTNIGPSSDPTFFTADHANVYIGLTIAGQPTATPTPTPTLTATPTLTPTPGPPFSPIGSFLTAAQKPTGPVAAVWTPKVSAPLNVGNFAVLAIALDNENDGSDGETTLVSSVTDQAGNTWTKAKEYTNGQGAPRAGVTISIWYSKITNQLNDEQTMSFTFSQATVAKAVKGYKYQWPAGNPVLDGTTIVTYDSAEPGSITHTGSNGKTHLWMRFNAAESPSKSWLTTTGWDKVNAAATTLDLPDTNVAVGWEYHVQISSSSGASDPTWYTADHVSVALGFYDDTPEATPTPTPTSGPTLTPTPTPTVDTSTRFGCMKVTNLNPTGEGSYHACATHADPKLCVFEVSGRIDLTASTLIKGNKIIAGETAPSPGILITGGTQIIGYSDTWFQHMQVRPGDAAAGTSFNQRDAVQISADGGRPPIRNVWVRNNTFSWGMDENGSTYGDTDLIRFTDNIVAEGLRYSYHNEGSGDEIHSSGFIIGEKTRRLRMARNLFIHNTDRNPLLKNNAQAKFYNNYIFNHGPTQKSNIPRMESLTSSLGPSKFDMMHNVMKPGVNSLPNMYGLYVDPTLALTNKYYVHGNIGDTRPSQALPDEAWVKPGNEANRSLTELIDDPIDFLMDADQVLDYLEAHAGARPWDRTPTDLRYFENARRGTGQQIDCVITERCTSGDVQVPEGGFPVMAQNEREIDCDADYNIVEAMAFLEQFHENPEPTPMPTLTPTPTITPGGPTLTPTPTALPGSGAVRLPVIGVG